MTTTMTREEREAYLAEVHIGVISIAEDGRGPLTAPIWYSYEPGGDVRFTTDADSRKGRLLTEGTRISFCVQTEKDPYKYVSVEGPVIAIEEADVERDERPLAHRYLGRTKGDRYIDATDGHRKENVAVAVRMRPERWLTVDYSKEDVGL